MTPLQLLIWTATSQAGSALVRVVIEGAAGAEVDVGVEVVAGAVAEAVLMGLQEVAAGVTAGVGEAGLGLLAKAEVVPIGQAKHAEQQPEIEQRVFVQLVLSQTPWGTYIMKPTNEQYGGGLFIIAD